MYVGKHYCKEQQQDPDNATALCVREQVQIGVPRLIVPMCVLCNCSLH